MAVYGRTPARRRAGGRARGPAQTHPPIAFVRGVALAAAGPQSITLGLAGETDTGLDITPQVPGGQNIPIGIAGETDTGLGATPTTTAGGPQGGLALLFPASSTAQSRTLGIAGETDSGLGVTPVGPTDQAIPVGIADETDIGLSAEPPARPPAAVDNAVPVAEVLADRVLIGVSE